jgi:hypothetical protein
MPQIALVNFAGSEGMQLGLEIEESFRARHHSVAMFHAGPSIVRAWRELNIEPDVLYLYVKVPDLYAERYLAQLQSHWSKHGPRPLVQCILERFFGARYQLALEKRWARVAYSPKSIEVRG